MDQVHQVLQGTPCPQEEHPSAWCSRLWHRVGSSALLILLPSAICTSSYLPALCLETTLYFKNRRNSNRRKQQNQTPPNTQQTTLSSKFYFFWEFWINQVLSRLFSIEILVHSYLYIIFCKHGHKKNPQPLFQMSVAVISIAALVAWQ